MLALDGGAFQKLLELDLRDDRAISDIVSFCLAAAIKKGYLKNLRSLFLSWTVITTKGAGALAAALHFLRLKDLYLRHEIEQAGREAIRGVLVDRKWLQLHFGRRQG